MVFVFSGIISIEQQIINARNYHTQIINKIQNIGSYDNEFFNSYIDTLNDEKLSIDVADDKLSVKVKYDFDIVVPLLGEINDNTLVGYTR